MRRTFALVALLATSWPHVAALECALGGGAHAAIPGHAAEGPLGHGPPAPLGHDQPAHEPVGHGAHDHGAHTHAVPVGTSPAGETDADSKPESASRAGLECALVMACGLVMIRAHALAAEGRVPAPATDGPLAAIDAPQGAVLVVDPPPPRRIA